MFKSVRSNGASVGISRHLLRPVLLWLEFHKASQTTAERGEAKLCVINFKTTWSEFQKLKQTAASNSIPLPLHVVLESIIDRSTFPCSVVV